MSMKARKQKQRKKKEDERVSFEKLLPCVSFSSCSSLAKPCHSSHVAHEYMTSVFLFFFLKRFAFGAYNA